MTRSMLLLALGTILSLLLSTDPASANYNPTVGRWMERDPIGNSDSMNLYPYGGDTPPNRLDPTGEIDSISTTVGASAGTVTANQAALQAARLTGNSQAVESAMKTLQRSLETFKGFITMITKMSPCDPKLKAVASSAEEELASANRTMQFLRQAVEYAKRVAPNNPQESVKTATENLNTSINSLKDTIQVHLGKIAAQPTSLDVPHWQDEIRAATNGIAAAQEAQKMVGQALQSGG